LVDRYLHEAVKLFPELCPRIRHPHLSGLFGKVIDGIAGWCDLLLFLFGGGR
jgi:hypothetical protein